MSPDGGEVITAALVSVGEDWSGTVGTVVGSGRITLGPVVGIITPGSGVGGVTLGSVVGVVTPGSEVGGVTVGGAFAGVTVGSPVGVMSI